MATYLVQLVVELPAHEESRDKAQGRCDMAVAKILELYPQATVEPHIWSVPK